MRRPEFNLVDEIAKAIQIYHTWDDWQSEIPGFAIPTSKSICLVNIEPKYHEEIKALSRFVSENFIYSEETGYLGDEIEAFCLLEAKKMVARESVI